MKQFKKLLILTIIGTFLFSCATSANQLKSAQASFDSGQYKAAIEYGLKSYELAMKKNKKPEETAQAKQFLEMNFPVAVTKLVEMAKKAEGGTNTEKVKAWEEWQNIVALNKLISSSIANSFLETSDYTKELERAKELASSIYYEEGDKAFSVGEKEFFKKAYNMYSYALMVVPGYKDAEDKMLMAQAKATTTYAIIIGNLSIEERVADEINDIETYNTDLTNYAMNFISQLDKPEFTNVVKAYSIKEAKSINADIAVAIDGGINLYSVKQVNNMYVIFSRGYNTKINVNVTNLKTGATASDFIQTAFMQSISINLTKTLKYAKEPMPQEEYYMFNDRSWNINMLEQAIENTKNNKTGEFIFWGLYEDNQFISYSDATVADLGRQVMNNENNEALRALERTYNFKYEFLNFENQSAFTGVEGSIFDAISYSIGSKLFSNNDVLNVLKSEM